MRINLSHVEEHKIKIAPKPLTAELSIVDLENSSIYSRL